MLNALKLPDNSARSSIGFWLCLAFLFLLVLAFCGKAIPFNNEYIYLLRLESGVLPNDWSFSQAASEHWLFNAIFSIPARFISIEAVGWVGRIAFWITCLAALLRLGDRWAIPGWATTLSIGIWLAIGQTVVNAEWIFGTFEAKVVAYACLLFALVGFSKQHVIAPAILLGLSFSFHPAVGLWAIPAVGLALLFERIRTAELLKVIGITFLFSLPGIVPLLADQTGAEATSIDDWQFIVTKHMPFHFDPFYFSKFGMVLLGLMLVFNIYALWRNEDRGLRFLLSFQFAIAAFFLLGIVFRGFELYPLLRFMPLRLFPVFTPLFFLFTAFNFYFGRRSESRRVQLASAMFVIAIIAFLHPFDEAVGQMRETKASWAATPDGLDSSLAWINENTPKDSVILTSPTSRKVWYLSGRAQVVSYLYPRYDRLSEWRGRIADLTNDVQITDRESSREQIDMAFDNLTAAQIEKLKQKYAATHLVSRTVYPFPVIFESGIFKVYDLR